MRIRSMRRGPQTAGWTPAASGAPAFRVRHSRPALPRPQHRRLAIPNATGVQALIWTYNNGDEREWRVVDTA